MKQSAMTIHVAASQTRKGVRIDDISFDPPASSIRGMREEFIGSCYDSAQELQTDVLESAQAAKAGVPWSICVNVPAVDPDR